MDQPVAATQADVRAMCGKGLEFRVGQHREQRHVTQEVGSYHREEVRNTGGKRLARGSATQRSTGAPFRCDAWRASQYSGGDFPKRLEPELARQPERDGG